MKIIWIGSAEICEVLINSKRFIWRMHDAIVDMTNNSVPPYTFCRGNAQLSEAILAVINWNPTAATILGASSTLAPAQFCWK